MKKKKKLKYSIWVGGGSGLKAPVNFSVEVEEFLTKKEAVDFIKKVKKLLK